MSREVAVSWAAITCEQQCMYFCKQLLFHFSLPASFNSPRPHSDFTDLLLVRPFGSKLSSPISSLHHSHLAHPQPPRDPIIPSLQMAQCISTWCCSSGLVIKCWVLRREQKGSPSLLWSCMQGRWKVAGETQKSVHWFHYKIHIIQPQLGPCCCPEFLLVVLSTPLTVPQWPFQPFSAPVKFCKDD